MSAIYIDGKPRQIPECISHSNKKNFFESIITVSMAFFGYYNEKARLPFAILSGLGIVYTINKWQGYSSSKVFVDLTQKKKEKNILVFVSKVNKFETLNHIDLSGKSLFNFRAFPFHDFNKLAEKNNLQIHEIGSISEMKMALRSYPRNTFDSMFFEVHGNSDLLVLQDKSGQINKFSILNMPFFLYPLVKIVYVIEKVIKKIFKRDFFLLPSFLIKDDFNCLKKEATICLASCSTGVGKYSIAKELSNILAGRLLFAPNGTLKAGNTEIRDDYTYRFRPAIFNRLFLATKRNFTKVFKSGYDVSNRYI